MSFVRWLFPPHYRPPCQGAGLWLCLRGFELLASVVADTEELGIPVSVPKVSFHYFTHSGNHWGKRVSNLGADSLA